MNSKMADKISHEVVSDLSINTGEDELENTVVAALHSIVLGASPSPNRADTPGEMLDHVLMMTGSSIMTLLPMLLRMKKLTINKLH